VSLWIRTVGARFAVHDVPKSPPVIESGSIGRRASRWHGRCLGSNESASPAARRNTKHCMLHRNVLRRFARALAASIGVVVVLAAAAAGVQELATRHDQRRFAPPGRLVEVEGHRLHIRCMGNDGPTVILEAMGDGTSANWAWVQPQIAEMSRVCAYDRAGRGWSDSSPAPRDALHIAQELRSLLANAGEAPPFVLVGHSFGGFVTRMYAAAFPHEVAGMVIVDGGQPGIRSARFPAEGSRSQAQEKQLMRAAPVLARLGMFRWRGMSTDLPPAASAEYGAHYASARLWDNLHAEMLALPLSDAQVRGAGSLGDRPLMIVNASRPDNAVLRANNAMQAELLSLSSNSQRLVVDGASHGSLVLNPRHAAETSAAILDVVRAVRSGGQLGPRAALERLGLASSTERAQSP
jgi:pimeloyl-ACP methyl ester carboxylesterase